MEEQYGVNHELKREIDLANLKNAISLMSLNPPSLVDSIDWDKFWAEVESVLG